MPFDNFLIEEVSSSICDVCNLACPDHCLVDCVQVIPVPDTPTDTLRQAFIGFGETQGLEFTELPRDIPLTQVQFIALHNGRQYWKVPHFIYIHWLWGTYNVCVLIDCYTGSSSWGTLFCGRV